jgi:exopolysaccharide biosynthesis polyprenyl glycosylphosphotransferase
MSTQQIRNWYTFSLVILDALMVGLAFGLAYLVRSRIPWPNELTAEALVFSQYVGMMGLQILSVLALLGFFQQYYIPRAISRVDQLYAVIAAVSVGTLLAVALSVLLLSRDFEFPRAMVAYAWLFGIVTITIGRTLHQLVRAWLLNKGLGKDNVLIIGSGEMARAILQHIIWSPQLGYEVVGIVNGQNTAEAMLGIPVLGTIEDLPTLIEKHRINEVIIATPEKGHRETVRIIALCERGEVSIKVFPDIFQFVATQPTIGDLGGLPLISVRDYAMRGYLLVFKRLIDILGAGLGLLFLSPLMMLVGLAIKLESPGAVFFVQERMGLDGQPFRIIKFRSMRNDAEKHGPGWTVDNDPRQTKLGRFLRRIELDELPQLINVLLGEMSLVGPRPEQVHYVLEFRNTVPRYMDRHRAKAGMTGWAQVNGMRGDTSIAERTKFDLWYIENWSVLLDLKIILRTFWQIVIR